MPLNEIPRERPLNEIARERLRGLGRNGGKLGYQPRGARICRLCDSPLHGRRQSWCSEQCVHAHALVTSSSYLRACVWERDEGVCRACGLDTHRVEKRLRGLWGAGLEARRAAAEYLRGLGFSVPGALSVIPSLWDADHIDALQEGGSWELSNVQTLCHPCHKRKTAEHAARRGKQRRLLGSKWMDQKKRERGL